MESAEQLTRTSHRRARRRLPHAVRYLCLVGGNSSPRRFEVRLKGEGDRFREITRLLNAEVRSRDDRQKLGRLRFFRPRGLCFPASNQFRSRRYELLRGGRSRARWGPRACTSPGLLRRNARNGKIHGRDRRRRRRAGRNLSSRDPIWPSPIPRARGPVLSN